MDPLNLSDTQGTPLNSKSNACPRNPAGCACCGLNDYPKNIPPAYYFTTLYPGIPNCKHCQDHIPENFAVPHSLFPSFPFQQPFFHSAIIPPNVYCSPKLLNDEGSCYGQKQSQCEHETTHRFAPQNERSAFTDGKSTKNESAQKSKQNLRSETSLPYFNGMESPFSAAFQRCVCGDSIPRPCNPFIMPVFSYYLVWNSQTSCQNLLSKNCNGFLTENLCQKNSKNLAGTIFPSAKETQEKLNVVKEDKAATVECDSKHEAPEVVHYAQEYLLVGILSETDCKNKEQTTENEENGYKIPQQEEVKEYPENISDVSDEEGISEDEPESGDDIKMKSKTESEESVIPDEIDVADGGLLPDLNINPSKSSEFEVPLQRHSSSDFKSTEKNSELSEVDSLSESQANVWPQDVHETNPEILLKEASEGKKSDDEDVDVSRTSVKKCIKNFTVANEISGDLNEEEKSTAAAGDLGGESCCDYSTKTSTPNNAKIFLEENYTGIHKKEKVSVKTGKEKLDENQNFGQKYKSGIAKLLYNSNSKASKTNPLKNTKSCKNDSNQMQNNVVKHKHCCFPTDNTNSSNESRYRIQKTKNSATAQRQSLGSEKQQKSSSSSQFLKKGNPSQKTFRPLNSFQKC